MNVIINLSTKKPIPPPPPPTKRPDPEPRYIRENQDPDKKAKR